MEKWLQGDALFWVLCLWYSTYPPVNGSVQYVRTYFANVFPSPLSDINYFLEKPEVTSSKFNSFYLYQMLISAQMFISTPNFHILYQNTFLLSKRFDLWTFLWLLYLFLELFEQMNLQVTRNCNPKMNQTYGVVDFQNMSHKEAVCWRWCL